MIVVCGGEDGVEDAFAGRFEALFDCAGFGFGLAALVAEAFAVIEMDVWELLLVLLLVALENATRLPQR